MNTVVRTAAFAAVAFTVNTTETWWLTRIQPEISTALALGQLNGSDANIQSLQWFEAETELVHTGAIVAVTGAAVLLFAAPVRRAWARHQRRLPAMLPVLLAALSSTCVHP